MATFKNTPAGGPTGTEIMGLDEAGTLVHVMTWYWPMILGITLLIVLAVMGRRRALIYVALAIVAAQLARLLWPV